MQGNISQIMGAVVDVEFPTDSVPNVHDALLVEGQSLTLEVQQQLGDGIEVSNHSKVSVHYIGKLEDLSEFDKTCKIGTGSPRRTEQIASINPDVIVKPIRGNIDTRIDKLKLKEYDGIVLALAGIRELYKTWK